MTNNTANGKQLEPQPPASWQQQLDDLERILREASWSIGLLRRVLEEGEQTSAPAPERPSQPIAPATVAAEPADAPPNAEAKAVESGPTEEATEPPSRRDAFARLWERIDHEKLEQDGEPTAKPEMPRRGLALLPQQYVITIEDKERQVDLTTVQRSLLSLAPMEDISLVKYANGVPVISLQTQGELDQERLGEAVSGAFDRECEVIDQGNGKLFLRLAARDG